MLELAFFGIYSSWSREKNTASYLRCFYSFAILQIASCLSEEELPRARRGQSKDFPRAVGLEKKRNSLTFCFLLSCLLNSLVPNPRPQAQERSFPKSGQVFPKFFRFQEENQVSAIFHWRVERLLQLRRILHRLGSIFHRSTEDS